MSNDNDQENILKRALHGSFSPAVAALSDGHFEPDAIIEHHHGFTLLHAAAYHSNLKIVQVLIHLGANPNTQDFRGQTPLHLAIQSTKSDHVVHYLASRTDLLLRDSLNMTCKLQACAHSNLFAYLTLRDEPAECDL